MHFSKAAKTNTKPPISFLPDSIEVNSSNKKTYSNAGFDEKGRFLLLHH
jgi:hypothetical protein